jgi:hypothetical protein
MRAVTVWRRGVLGLMTAAMVASSSAPRAADAGAAAQAMLAHDKDYWRAVIKKEYAVPSDEPMPVLLAELTRALGSADPEVRDQIGYSILSAWIYRQRVVPVELRRTMLTELTANMKKGIGERDTDGVFARSFSALSLGVLVALDNEVPYMTPSEFNSLFTAAITYLRDEEDIRGFDSTKGWMHSAAHTADLLRFLGRGRYPQSTQQLTLLRAIGDKLTSVGVTFTHGEDERLARAVLSLAARPEFDQAAFREWTTSLVTPAPAGPTTAASIASVENRKHVLVSLFALLSTDARDLPSLRAARSIVLAALRG